ncbi:protein GbcA [Pseudomonas jessenii]|uniref:Protein GbcA n=1 Tax=Pseudomonas jessenii TaxID=77298 RepID=A0A2W0EQU5_PSEJE|nr:protein GbcA [Pseudomonas jessenii]
MLAILRIARTTRLPICDIDMLIATSPQLPGLARREQIAPCRPWIRFWPAPAPHSPQQITAVFCLASHNRSHYSPATQNGLED